jgi:hypothetical protein
MSGVTAGMMLTCLPTAFNGATREQLRSAVPLKGKPSAPVQRRAQSKPKLGFSDLFKPQQPERKLLFKNGKPAGRGR